MSRKGSRDFVALRRWAEAPLLTWIPFCPLTEVRPTPMTVLFEIVGEGAAVGAIDDDASF